MTINLSVKNSSKYIDVVLEYGKEYLSLTTIIRLTMVCPYYRKKIPLYLQKFNILHIYVADAIGLKSNMVKNYNKYVTTLLNPKHITCYKDLTNGRGFDRLPCILSFILKCINLTTLYLGSCESILDIPIFIGNNIQYIHINDYITKREFKILYTLRSLISAQFLTTYSIDMDIDENDNENNNDKNNDDEKIILYNKVSMVNYHRNVISYNDIELYQDISGICAKSNNLILVCDHVYRPDLIAKCTHLAENSNINLLNIADVYVL